MARRETLREDDEFASGRCRDRANLRGSGGEKVGCSRACACCVPPASVARLLAARRDPAEWRSSAGREPSATVVSKASSNAWAVRRSLQEPSGSCISSRCNVTKSSDATVQARRFIMSRHH
eukprot:scaffold23436_cov68-Phaeocystis_antarctica.AAC.8